MWHWRARTVDEEARQCALSSIIEGYIKGRRERAHEPIYCCEAVPKRTEAQTVINYLREQLLEVVEHVPRLSGEHGQGCVVAHATQSLFTAHRHGIEQHVEGFLFVEKHGIMNTGYARALRTSNIRRKKKTWERNKKKRKKEKKKREETREDAQA